MISFLYLISCTIFASVFLFTYALMSSVKKRRLLLERFSGSNTFQRDLLKRKEEENSLTKRFLRWVSSFGRLALKDQEGLSLLRSTLGQAGFRHLNAAAIYFGLRALIALLLPLPYLFLIIWHGKISLSSSPFVALMLSGIGYFLPNYFLKARIRRRQDRMDKALPDVLDLMIVAMEAGLSLQGTLNRVAEEVRPLSRDLCAELQITNAELRTGITRNVALRNLGERTGVQSIKSLVALMVQSEKMGASISQALRMHGDFIRVQRGQKAEEIAGRLPVKILFPLMLCILPALFIVILGPAAIKMSQTLFK